MAPKKKKKGSKKSKKAVKEGPPASASAAQDAEQTLLKLTTFAGPGDIDLDVANIPSLVDMCLDTIVSNFEEYPVKLSDLPPKYHDRVVNMLPLNLPLPIAIQDIHSELYWTRACQTRWDNCHKEKHGSSWKRLYLERNLEEVLESFDSQQILDKTTTQEQLLEQFQKLLEIMDFSKDHILGLELRQLISHLDINILSNNLPNLATLSLSYGVRRIGLEFEWDIFGMRTEDCHSMAHVLRNTRRLTVLRLNENLLDDRKLRILASGLAHNNTITDLGLCHNKIGDAGARALASVLTEKNCVLTALDLHDNQIEEAGGKALARALEQNGSLLRLDVRLNHIGDEGARAMADALKGNASLLSLNISCNGVGAEPLRAVAMQARSSALKHLDMSNNPGLTVPPDTTALQNNGVHVDIRMPQPVDI